MSAPRRTALLAAAALSGVARGVSAQDPATAPLVLRLPGSTRALGLGDAFAGGRGVEMIFYNPAQIGVVRGTGLSWERFGRRTGLGTFVTAGTLGRVAVAAGVQYLEYESVFQQLARPNDLTTRNPLDATSLAASVAASLTWKGVRWGVAAKYAEEHRDFSRVGQGLVDVGAARDIGRLGVGISVQNLGSDFLVGDRLARLPTRVSTGVYYPTRRIATYFDFGAAAGLSLERGGRLVPAGGAELTWEPVGGWRLALRGGVHGVESGRPSESPLVFGGSFTFDRFSLDYAFQPWRRGTIAAQPGFAPSIGRAAHRIGIRIQ